MGPARAEEAVMPRSMSEEEMSPGHPELWRRMPAGPDPVGAGLWSQSMNSLPCEPNPLTCPCLAHVGDRAQKWLYAPSA